MIEKYRMVFKDGHKKTYKNFHRAVDKFRYLRNVAEYDTDPWPEYIEEIRIRIIWPGDKEERV